MALAAYEVQWNDEQPSIQEAIRRIHAGVFPDELVIFNQNYGTISISRPGMYGSDYTVSRSGPSPFGRGGLARTFANAPLDEAGLLAYIFDAFYDLEAHLGKLNVARTKLQHLQLEGAKKMLNRKEANIGKNMPLELRGKIAEMLGEKKPVPGAYNVQNNMAKIQTNLFQGGKRTRKGSKGTKRSKGRKQTRKN